MAARTLMPNLAEFLIYREVEYRKSHGLREMIHWTAEELEDASNMSSRTTADILRSSHACGTISALLCSHLAKHELACRKSNHELMEAISENMSFLARCQKSLEEEREAAELWAEDRKANGWPIFTYYESEKHCEDDRIMIAYRDMKGW